MTSVLDSGALIALDKNDRAMWVRLKASAQAGEPPKTHGGIVGQVWRDGARQARLARAISGMSVAGLDRELGSAAGELLAVAGHTDVVDAALALLAVDGDDIFTSDVDDIALLAGCAGQHVEIIRV